MTGSSTTRGSLRRTLVAYWLPPALYLATIWALSSRSSLLPDVPPFPHFDKVAHFAEYGVLGLLLARAVGRSLGRYAVGAAIAIAVAYGALDEVHQAFVPGRQSSLLDVAADLVGATAGALVWAWLPRCTRALSEP